MQLSSIALATIFITLFTTGPVTSSSVSEARAMFQKLARETEAAKKEPQPGPKGRKQPPTGPKPTPPTAPTKSMKPVVGPYPPPPSSSKSAESTGKPVQPPTEKPKPTAVPLPRQPSQPRVPLAPKQPATERSAPAPLFLKPGELMTPSQLEEQQQESQRSTAQASKAPESTASRVSSVAKLARTWGGSVPSSKPVSSTSSASPSKPSPQPTPGTSSEPLGPPPKVTSIPEDADFTCFKKAIEQGKYSDAMKIVDKLPEEKSREPYSRLLASFEVSKIIEMVESFKETVAYETMDGEPATTVSLDYTSYLATLGLFLIHADDAKFGELLQKAKLKPEIQDEALLFSIEHNASLTPEGFIRVFKTLTHMPSRALEAAANSMFRYGKSNDFFRLIGELEKRNILDKDLVNFAYNAAFVEACRLNIPFFAEKYYKQATILSSMYAKAIVAFCAKEHEKWGLFNWFLEHAGGDDLLLTLREGSGILKENILDKIGKRYAEVSHKARQV